MILENRTTDKRFSDRWLFEIPQRTGPSGSNPYDLLVMGMKTNEEYGHSPISLGNNLYMMSVDPNYAYYWIELNDEIEIIAGVKPFENGLAIGDVGKRLGGKIWASDFYQAIVDSTHEKLLFSGDQISDEGYKIWKNLIRGNHKLFGYDPSDTMKYSNIDSEEDLKKFAGSSEEHKKLRFVLSENSKVRVGSVWTSFEMLRIHRLVHKY